MFRRAFAIGAIRSGILGASVMRLAGWRNPTMLSRYTSSVAEELALDEYARAYR